MSLLQSFPVEDVVRRGSIRDTDVALLRSALEQGASLSSAEAEQLVALNQVCPVQHAAWGSLFVDALTDHFVDHVAPEGYLTAANAERLVALISREGRIASKTELDLLLGVLEAARWAPVSLVCYALEQVREAVATGEGPVRAGAALPAGTIGDGEVEFVRRVVYAYGSGCLPVTRMEAEVLLDINDALDAPAPEAWTDLFVKAIANLILSSSGHAVPNREAALGRGPGGETCGACSEEAEGSVAMLYPVQSYEERAIARLERQRIEIITGEAIAPSDPAWLAARLGRAGALSETAKVRLAEFLSRAPAPGAALGTLRAGPQSRLTAAE